MKHLKYKGEKTDFGVSKKGNVYWVFSNGSKMKPAPKVGKITTGIAKYMKKHEL